MTNQELYNLLCEFCSLKDNNCFYKDAKLGDRIYRVFSYQHEIVNNFRKHDWWITECRGILFEIDEHENFIRLASRPLRKFFNYMESDLVGHEKFNPQDICEIMNKVDGYLVSSFMDGDELHVKSKTTLGNFIVEDSLKLLNKDKVFKNAVIQACKDGYTTCMEYTDPNNPIIIVSPEKKLTVLNLRNNDDGSVLTQGEMESKYPELYKRSAYLNLMSYPDPMGYETLVDWVKDIQQLKGIEGFVLRMNDGTFLKIKTKWYFDSSFAQGLSVRRAFNNVVTGDCDDFKSIALINAQQEAYDLQVRMEQFVYDTVNSTFSLADKYYQHSQTIGLEPSGLKEYISDMVKVLNVEHCAVPMVFGLLYHNKGYDRDAIEQCILSKQRKMIDGFKKKYPEYR